MPRRRSVCSELTERTLAKSDGGRKGLASIFAPSALPLPSAYGSLISVRREKPHWVLGFSFFVGLLASSLLSLALRFGLLLLEVEVLPVSSLSALSPSVELCEPLRECWLGLSSCSWPRSSRSECEVLDESTSNCRCAAGDGRTAFRLPESGRSGFWYLCEVSFRVNRASDASVVSSSEESTTRSWLSADDLVDCFVRFIVEDETQYSCLPETLGRGHFTSQINLRPGLSSPHTINRQF